MSPAARIAALGLAAAVAGGGAALQVAGASGIGLLILAVLIVVGTVFEARYRGSRSAAPGQWQDTGEREVDQETATILAVWYDPISGERRYVPTGKSHE